MVRFKRNGEYTRTILVENWEKGPRKLVNTPDLVPDNSYQYEKVAIIDELIKEATVVHKHC